MPTKMFVMAAMLCLLPLAAEAQSCGEPRFGNDLWQIPNQMTLQHQVMTGRTWSLCPITVVAEGWIWGLNNTAAQAHHTWSAVTNVYAPVSNAGRYSGQGRHFAVVGGWQWINLGETRSECDVRVPDAPPECNPPLPEWYCEDGGGWVSANGCNCEYSTPLITSLTGDQVRMGSLDACVVFDINADGQRECVTWPEHGSWLAYDRNGNGQIDDGSELFGDHTPVAPGAAATQTADNGFEALKFFEGFAYQGRIDSAINASDGIYGRLVWWTDYNHDGVSTPEELLPVSESGLLGISLDYKELGRRDENGNQYALRSDAEWLVTKNGQSKVDRRPIWDVMVKRQ